MRHQLQLHEGNSELAVNIEAKGILLIIPCYKMLKVGVLYR